MKIFISPYELTPKKRANRLSSLEKRPGVYLKGILKDKHLFADYFPHQALGDRPVEEFLEKFKFQQHEYDKKVFQLLLQDHEFQKPVNKIFSNHQLWSKDEEVLSTTLKYKLMDPDDRGFMPLLEKGKRLRIDGNGIFKRDSFNRFLKDIHEKHRTQIDYFEDPLSEKDWSNLGLSPARDFIDGAPFDYYIYKPNCEARPDTSAKVIYSAYMGGSLGNWHAISELLRDGDLKLTHGLITRGFYEEEVEIVKGSYTQGFTPDEGLVKKLYQDMAAKDWKLLCSM